MADTTKRMDRAEITRRVERAEKLLQKGKTNDALEEYLQVLAEDPQNDAVRQMAAELCLSQHKCGQRTVRSNHPDRQSADDHLWLRSGCGRLTTGNRIASEVYLLNQHAMGGGGLTRSRLRLYEDAWVD